MSGNEMSIIAKNSGVSIGLVITLMVFIFWGGLSLGSINTELETHKALPAHNGHNEKFVPRTEVQLQFTGIQKDIKEIKATQKEILRELRK